MGISLAICSPIYGSGKTVLTFLLAHRLSKILKKEISILICCTCMEGGDIRKIVGAGDDYLSLEDLVNVKVSSTNTDINTNSLLYNSGNLFFIDTSKATPLFVKKNSARYQELLKHLKQDFDLVITDTSSDPANPLTQYIMVSCDHVLNIAVQDVQLLDKKPIITPKDITYIINRYANMYPDKKELLRLLGTKNIFTLPYCSQLQEMKNRHKFYQYAGLDTEYMKAVDKLTGFLVEALHLPEGEKKKNKRFTHLLKKGGRQ